MERYRKIPMGGEKGRGKYAIVDWDAPAEVTEKRWHLDNRGYAVRRENGRNLYIHRIIAQTPDDMLTDHINGNPLDDRRENLRICTHAENMRNSRRRSSNKSGFKGVSKQRDKWIATIAKDNKDYYLGRFTTPKAAYQAYKKAAKELHGEFAKI